MLIRFIVNNVLSFGEEREFNMIPYSQLQNRLPHHSYSVKDDFSLLKMAALYGANGAGKSNLITSLWLFQQIILEKEIIGRFHNEKFRLDENNQIKSQILGVEFISKNKPYLYAIEIDNGIVLTEELYHSGLGKKENELVFERKTNFEGKTTLKFHSAFEADTESRTLQKVIEKTLAKPEKLIFKLAANLENEFLKDVKQAYYWFEYILQIIMPKTQPFGMVWDISQEKAFREFANKNITTFNTGIKKISVQKVHIDELANEEEKSFIVQSLNSLKNQDNHGIRLRNEREEIIAMKENGEIFINRLILEHHSKQDKPVYFYRYQESDGTNRLIDYLPALNDVLHQEVVYLIDEIERSLHPMIIKEILRKFSKEKNTKGQLIFTTHESNLLDQSIFRPDEIWFVEKDKWGCSDLYPLSEFKEHKTKDIRKGYLNGRYGAIPFLGNLKDLNWSQYAAAE